MGFFMEDNGIFFYLCKKKDMSDLYEKRGVSASKSEVHAAIKNLDKGIFPNAFCKVMPDIVGGDPLYANIMHADTAGTKTSLAYLYWKETGDLSIWEGVVQDAIVMNIDDMACTGAVQNILLSSTIGRNKHLIPAEVLAAIIGGTSQFISSLEKYGIHLHLTGGETADVGDIVRTVDIGFTTFCRLPRAEVVDIAIQPGQVLVGFSSAGKALWEKDYNGGMGSNGLTSARHDVLHKKYAQRYPESFDPLTDPQWIYAGTMDLLDKVETPYGERTLGQLLLSPTRTYLPLIKEMLALYRDKISGLVHNSGGAHSKVVKFLNKARVVKDQLPPAPPLFELIRAQSGSSLEEMYQVFNMGIRLEAYTDPATAVELVALAEQYGIEAWVIGRVEAAEVAEVEMQVEGKNWIYKA
jgi:phosphoribosylformylglycinamidine cyclo-ligase